jgi:hypothetical protein
MKDNLPALYVEQKKEIRTTKKQLSKFKPSVSEVKESRSETAILAEANSMIK